MNKQRIKLAPSWEFDVDALNGQSVDVLSTDGKLLGKFKFEAEAPPAPDPDPSGTVNMTAEWLQSNVDSGGFWVLDKPDTQYILHSDVESPRTNFVINAFGVTLNTNGYDLTCGTDDSFGQFSDGDLVNGNSDWDIDGAWEWKQDAVRVPQRGNPPECFSGTTSLAVTVPASGSVNLASINKFDLKENLAYTFSYWKNQKGGSYTGWELSATVGGEEVKMTGNKVGTANTHRILAPSDMPISEVVLTINNTKDAEQTLLLDRFRFNAADCHNVAQPTQRYTPSLPDIGYSPKPTKYTNIKIPEGSVLRQGRGLAHSCGIYVGWGMVTVNGGGTIETHEDSLLCGYSFPGQPIYSMYKGNVHIDGITFNTKARIIDNREYFSGYSINIKAIKNFFDDNDVSITNCVSLASPQGFACVTSSEENVNVDIIGNSGTANVAFSNGFMVNIAQRTGKDTWNIANNDFNTWNQGEFVCGARGIHIGMSDDPEGQVNVYGNKMVLNELLDANQEYGYYGHMGGTWGIQIEDDTLGGVDIWDNEVTIKGIGGHPMRNKIDNKSAKSNNAVIFDNTFVVDSNSDNGIVTRAAISFVGNDGNTTPPIGKNKIITSRSVIETGIKSEGVQVLDGLHIAFFHGWPESIPYSYTYRGSGTAMFKNTTFENTESFEYFKRGMGTERVNHCWSELRAEDSFTFVTDPNVDIVISNSERPVASGTSNRKGEFTTSLEWLTCAVDTRINRTPLNIFHSFDVRHGSKNSLFEYDGENKVINLISIV